MPSRRPVPTSWNRPVQRRWVGIWAALWAVLVLLPAMLTLGDAEQPAIAGAGLVVVAVLFTCALVGSLGRPLLEPPMAWCLVGGQGLVTAALALLPGFEWASLALLLAIAVGAVVATRSAPTLVVGVAVLGAAVQHARGAAWTDAIWGTGLTTLLAGLLTCAFGWLGSVISELRCAQGELAQAAVNAERVRFSRDLHDLLGQTLSVIVVKAQAARRSAATDPAGTAAHAADIETIGRQALTEVRQAVQGYRRPHLEEELTGAVQALQAAGISATVDRGHHPLSRRQDEVLGWVVREGATNVLRHAGASRVAITTTTGPLGTMVRIADDGAGTHTGSGSSGPGPEDRAVTDGVAGAPVPGSGLPGLRGRVLDAGGTLQAHRGRDGFSLTATVPHDPTEELP